MQIYTFVTKQGQHYWNIVPITGHKQENSVSNTGITTPQTPKGETRGRNFIFKTRPFEFGVKWKKF